MPFFYQRDEDIIMPENRSPLLSREAVVVLTVIATGVAIATPVIDEPWFTAAAAIILPLLGVFGVRPRVWSEESHANAVGAAYTRGRVSNLRDGK